MYYCDDSCSSWPNGHHHVNCRPSGYSIEREVKSYLRRATDRSASSVKRWILPSPGVGLVEESGVARMSFWPRLFRSACVCACLAVAASATADDAIRTDVV